MEINSSTRAIIIAVFAIYTIVLFVYSLISRKEMKSTKLDKYVEQFATGGRAGGVLTTAMVVAAGIAGAGVFLGVPGFINTFGSVWLVCCFWSMSCTLTSLGIVGKKTGIVARRTNSQTFVELLYHRFNHNKVYGIMASLVVLVFLGLFAVSTLVGGGRIFQVLTGQPYWIGLAIFTALVMIAALSGGVKGVSTAIVIQGLVMTLCVILLFLFGINSAGNLDVVIRNLAETQPEWFVPQWKWQQVFTYAVLWGFCCFTLPHTTMGALTYKDTKTLHNAMKVGMIVYLIWLVGLNLLAFPIKALFTSLPSADLGIPMLAVTVLPPWIAGLVLAGVCAAVQSSVGGMILSLATCFVRDLFNHCISPNASDMTLKKVTLSATVGVSVVVFIIALNPPTLLASLITYSTGGLLAAFMFNILLGYYWKGTNEYGAIVGIVTGIAFYIMMDKGICSGAALGMNPCIMASVYSGVLTVIVSKITPKTPYGIIATWFGEVYPNSEQISS